MSEAEVSAMVGMSCLRDWKFKLTRCENLSFDRSLKLEESDRRHRAEVLLDNSSWCTIMYILREAILVHLKRLRWGRGDILCSETAAPTQFMRYKLE